MKQHTHLLLASLLVSLLAGLTAIADETPGGRTGRFIFDARYIVDTGSYLTNDTCHVALTKTANIIPDDTEVLVYARPVVSTNASDWVQLLPLRTIAEHPADYYLANAISNDVMVTANYVPPSPVITNFLFTTACKICLGITPTTSLPLVVPHAKSVIVDQYDSEVEWLQSYGNQSGNAPWIDTEAGDADHYLIEWKTTNANQDIKIFGNSYAYGKWRDVSIYQNKYRGTSIATTNDTWDTIEIDVPTHTLTVSRDGVVVGTATSWWQADSSATDNTTYGSALPLFGHTNSYGQWFGDNRIGTWTQNYRVYCRRFKAWRNGVLVRDLISVRVGSTGYMFDAVSGKLFGNAGTGSFLVGPDL